MDIIKEACVEGYQEAIQAKKLGADRLELCSSLNEDGLTPDRNTITSVLNATTIPVKIMIRPRPGNFIYSQKEISQMELDISFCKKQGIEEVVFGCLDSKKRVDIVTLKRLANISYPMKITFHKAIDHTHNIFVEMDRLVKCRVVDSVLTSGESRFVLKKKTLLMKILKHYKDKLNIILAGGINQNNFDTIHQVFQWNEYHGRKIVGNLRNTTKKLVKNL
ncbi:MAG: copper homeostasis protein CutC [Candidatus Neomarinimicrobiota bacterium]